MCKERIQKGWNSMRNKDEHRREKEMCKERIQRGWNSVKNKDEHRDERKIKTSSFKHVA